MSQSENFPGGLWINGVRVDVAGRIAPKRAAQSKETAGAGQPTKPSMASSLLPIASRTMLLGRIGRHTHEWSLIPVGGTGRVVSTPNRRVDQCSSRTNTPWLLSGPVSWTVPHEALIGLDPANTPPALKTAFTKDRQPRQSRLEYLKRRCLLRCRQAILISTSMVGVTLGQDAGRVDSAPGRLLSLALRPGTAIVVVPNGQVLIEGRVVSTPNRSVTQRPRRRNSSWLPSGSVFWTIPHEALIDRNQASTQIAADSIEICFS